MNTVFESENIRCVEGSEELIPDYLTMINDMENVQRFIGVSHGPFTAEQEADWVRGKLEEKACVFSMIDKNTGAFIGNIEFMDLTDSEGELGIAVTAEKQEAGYGTEAVAALIQYGFNRLGLKRIFLRTRPWNARAIHVYEKCGLREYQRNGDHVFMERFR